MNIKKAFEKRFLKSGSCI